LNNRNTSLAAAVQLPVIASGGVATVNDVMRDSDSPLVEPDNGQQSDRVAAGPIFPSKAGFHPMALSDRKVLFYLSAQRHRGVSPTPYNHADNQ
jgi:hypothetical protein